RRLDSMVPTKPGFPIRRRTAQWMAVAIAAGAVALLLAALALMYADRHSVPPGPTVWDFADVSGDMGTLAVPAVGLVIAWRRPGNPIGWLFLVAALTEALWAFST